MMINESTKMDKLIYADAIKHKAAQQYEDACRHDDDVSVGRAGATWDMMVEIDHMDGVDAIPVEWLQKQADYARSEWGYDTCEGIRLVLNAWQKEQETNNAIG